MTQMLEHFKTEQNLLQAKLDSMNLTKIPEELIGSIIKTAGYNNEVKWSEKQNKYIVIIESKQHKKKYKPNEMCFCGSEIKYKKCCYKYYNGNKNCDINFFKSPKYYRNTNIPK